LRRAAGDRGVEERPCSITIKERRNSIPLMSIVYARTAEWGLSAIDSASLGAGSEKERTE